MEEKIALAEMIQMLRQELERAQTQSQNAGIVFETEKVELELQVALESKTSGKAGVKFWVIDVGGGLEKSGATTHTFKLTLKPVSSDGRGPLIVSKETIEEPSRK